MITYNDIYEVARKERYSEQLQKLPDNFIEDISNYLREKKDMASKESDVFSDVIIKTKKQLESAMTLFKELIRKRKNKILNLVLIAAETGISKKDFDNMLDFEKLLFESLVGCIENFDKKLNENMNSENNRNALSKINGGINEQSKLETDEVLEKISEKQKNLAVIFKEDVDEFVDLNGEKAGPFKKGQTASLHSEIAKILAEDSKVEIKE